MWTPCATSTVKYCKSEKDSFCFLSEFLSSYEKTYLRYWTGGIFIQGIGPFGKYTRQNSLNWLKLQKFNQNKAIVWIVKEKISSTNLTAFRPDFFHSRALLKVLFN